MLQVCVSYIVNFYVIQLIVVNADPIQTTFNCIETRITRSKMCLHNLSIGITFFTPNAGGGLRFFTWAEKAGAGVCFQSNNIGLSARWESG